MRKFNIGDRVLYTYKGYGSGMSQINGLMGTVVDFTGDNVGVQFDVNIKSLYGFGHDCEGEGKPGHCRYLDEPELELVDDKPVRIRWYKKGKLQEKMITKFSIFEKYEDIDPYGEEAWDDVDGDLSDREFETLSDCVENLVNYYNNRYDVNITINRIENNVYGYGGKSIKLNIDNIQIMSIDQIPDHHYFALSAGSRDFLQANRFMGYIGYADRAHYRDKIRRKVYDLIKIYKK